MRPLRLWGEQMGLSNACVARIDLKIAPPNVAETGHVLVDVIAPDCVTERSPLGAAPIIIGYAEGDEQVELARCGAVVHRQGEDADFHQLIGIHRGLHSDRP